METWIKGLIIGSIIGCLIGIISIFFIPQVGFIFAIIPGILYCSITQSCSGEWGGLREAIIITPFFTLLIGAIIGFIITKIKSKN